MLTVLLIGISQSGFGGAMGGLSVPLLSPLIATPQAAAIMLVLDAIGLVVFRGQGDKANLRITIPGGMIGIVLGALTFQLVDSRWIKAVIGVEALLFGVDRLRQVGPDGGAANAPAPAKFPSCCPMAFSACSTWVTPSSRWRCCPSLRSATGSG